MSFLFGGGRGHAHPEMAEGRKRAERRFARDIGQESSLSDDTRSRRRVRMWPVAVVVAAMLLGGLGLLPHVHRFELATSCSTPAVALEKYDAAPGVTVEWKATGPDSGDYVLVMDGRSVTTRGDTVQVDGGTALSPVFRMTNCAADQGLAAPRIDGTHNVRLFHRPASGTDFQEVAAVALTVRQ